MQYFNEILIRLKKFYPSLDINIWTKDDAGRLIVENKTILKFNAELLNKQLEKNPDTSVVEISELFVDYIKTIHYKNKKKRTPGCALNLTEAQIRYAIENTVSNFAAAKFLKVSYLAYKKYAKKYNLWEVNLNPRGFGTSKGGRTGGFVRAPLSEIFANKRPIYSTKVLKRRLIKEGILEEKCQICGLSEKRTTDFQVPLLLDFNDGNRKNYALENLQLLCLNCTFLYSRNLSGTSNTPTQKTLTRLKIQMQKLNKLEDY